MRLKNESGAVPSRKFISVKKIRENFEIDRSRILRYYKRTTKIPKSYYTEADLWSVDNFRFVKGLLEETHDSLNIKYLGRLPTLSDKNVRIYCLIADFLKCNSLRYQETGLRNYLEKYQNKKSLTIGEVWAAPLILKVILIQNLAQILDNFPKKSLQKSRNNKEGRVVKNIILSFLAINKTDWRVFFESVSKVEKILRKDPARIYPNMDFATRDSYRHAIEQMAIQSNSSEIEIADKIISIARKESQKKSSPVPKKHIGSYLVGYNREKSEKEINYTSTPIESIKKFIQKFKNYFYFLPLFFFSLTMLVASGCLFYLNSPSVSFWNFLIFVFCLVPAVVVAEDLLNFILVRIFRPSALYKMNYETGVPPDSRTMVVFPTLLCNDENEPKKLAEMLEKNFLSNRDPNIFFGLLLAFPDTNDNTGVPTETEKGNFERLISLINDLNQKYSRSDNIFHVFLRKRFWNQAEEAAFEWERKRGKIIEFNRLLRGDRNTSFETESDLKFLGSIKYVITLDYNELLPKDAGKKLIATISHPLNAPQLDKSRGVVAQGYGIIQPRVTGFWEHRPNILQKALFAGNSWDPYSSVVSDIYQDFYGYGLFLGKGIYDVDITRQVLDGRFPENRVLSHDHLEGFYCRTGNASDIQVFEDQPADYLGYVKRLTRWIRGDWQNLSWLAAKVRVENGTLSPNPLVFQQRWKLLDNAVRSLFLPSIFLMLTISFLFAPALSLTVLILSLAYLFFQPLLGLLDFLKGINLTLAYRETGRIIFDQALSFLLGAGFLIIFSGHLAFLSVGNILKTIYRLIFSKKHLLEWDPSHNTANRLSGSRFFRTVREFYLYEIFLLFILFMIKGSPYWSSPIATLIVCWIFSPVFAYFYSFKEKEIKDSKKITRHDAAKLRQIAIRTWRYFDELANPKNNFIPPDHYQEHGRRQVAQMTSITNIGMYLISIQAAADMGFICTDRLLSSTVKVFESLQRMERYKGHFFNWYSTTTLKPMLPKYISTVDSGNFVATLLTTKQALIEIFEKDLTDKAFFESLSTQIEMVSRIMHKAEKKPAYRPIIKKARVRLYKLQTEMIRKSPTDIEDFYGYLKLVKKNVSEILGDTHVSHVSSSKGLFQKKYWVRKLRETIAEKETEINGLFPWLSSEKYNGIYKILNQARNLSELSTALENLLSDAPGLAKEDLKLLRSSQYQIRAYEKVSEKIIQTIDKYLEQIDFNFLYSKSRKLLKIGYNLTKKRYDRNHYDLLASESRTASFIAVAEDKIPLEHWTLLSRPLAAVRGRVALFSWGGSMFEYLFSQIFLPNIKGSLLDIASQTALAEQLKYAKEKKIPWGISESSYYQKNKAGDYLYSLHGVSYLGLKPAPVEDLVVSPYSTFLALETNPREALNNINRLENEGAVGVYGFYESIDYNSKVEYGTSVKIINQFLSHHQSSILVCISNFLSDSGSRKRFIKNLQLSSLEFLLNEKFTPPAKIHSAQSLQKEARIHQIATQVPEPVEENYQTPPIMNLISNGRHKIFITNRGSGFSEFEDFRLTNWIPDPTLDQYGTFVYIKDNQSQTVWSPTYQPIRTKPKYYEVETSETESFFERNEEGTLSRLQVGLINRENLEYRTLFLKNNTSRVRNISVAYYSEAILARAGEDRSHPAFSRLKNEVTRINTHTFLYSRLSYNNEPTVFLGQKVLTSKKPLGGNNFITSRKVFIGRLGTLESPAALKVNHHLTDKAHVFDHIFGLVQNYKLRPFEEIEICFLSSAAKNPEKITNLLQKYQKLSDIEKSIRDNLGDIKTNLLVEPEILQKMLSCLLFRRRTVLDVKKPLHPQNTVLPYPKIRERISIYNDYPMLVTRLTGRSSKTTFRQLSRYACALARKGFNFNFVILAYENEGYYQKTSDVIQKTFEEIGAILPDGPVFSNLFVLRDDALTKNEIQGLETYSNLFIDTEKGSLSNLIETEYRKI